MKVSVACEFYSHGLAPGQVHNVCQDSVSGRTEAKNAVSCWKRNLAGYFIIAIQKDDGGIIVI